MTDIIKLAREAGFRASVGKTDKEGNYHPDKNALSKDVPIEWLERFAALVRESYRAELLEGSGDAVAWVRPSGLAMLEAGGYCTVYRSDGMSNYSAPLHTADQQAAAVLKARNQALEDAAVEASK